MGVSESREPVKTVSAVVVGRDVGWVGSSCHIFKFTASSCDVGRHLVLNMDMQYFLKGQPQLARLFGELRASPPANVKCVGSLGHRCAQSVVGYETVDDECFCFPRISIF